MWKYAAVAALLIAGAFLAVGEAAAQPKSKAPIINTQQTQKERDGQHDFDFCCQSPD